MKRSSIGRILYKRLVGVLVFSWLVVVLMVAWVVDYETQEIFDSGLQETAQRILPLAIHEIEQHLEPNGLRVLEPMAHDEYLTYQVFSGDGQLVLRSHNAPQSAYTVPLQRGFYNVLGQRFYVEASQDGRMLIQVAERVNHRQEMLSALLVYLFLPLGILLPAVAWGVFIVVKDAQKSMLRLGSELSMRNSHDLHPIPTDRLPLELVSLGDAVNGLMRRLNLALDAERSFSANSAHELRTPIAIALAQLDVLTNELVDPALNARVVEARKTISRLDKMTGKLLQLAKAESGIAFNFSKIELNALTKMLIDDLSFRFNMIFKFVCPDNPVFILGDLDAIGIVIQNLLENACHYTEGRQCVEVTISSSGKLDIKNDCCAVSALLMQSLGSRFVRANQDKAGSGLGLSIVKTILNQCNAQIMMQSPCFDYQRGFAVYVQFNLAD